jgi:hypothetical protein
MAHRAVDVRREDHHRLLCRQLRHPLHYCPAGRRVPVFFLDRG